MANTPHSNLLQTEARVCCTEDAVQGGFLPYVKYIFHIYNIDI